MLRVDIMINFNFTSTLRHYNNENAKPFTKKMIKFKIKCQMGQRKLYEFRKSDLLLNKISQEDWPFYAEKIH